MQFQSAIRRQMWFTSFASTGLDAVLAAILAKSFFESFWPAFLLIFGFLFLWPMVYGIRSALYSLAIGLLDRRSAIERLKEEFTRHRLPANEHSFYDADEYFNSVICSKDAPETAKIFAAGVLGAIAAGKAYSSIDTMKTYSRIEQALQEYSASKAL